MGAAAAFPGTCCTRGSWSFAIRSTAGIWPSKLRLPPGLQLIDPVVRLASLRETSAGLPFSRITGLLGDRGGRADQNSHLQPEGLPSLPRTAERIKEQEREAA